jgi:hypothetical protein
LSVASRLPLKDLEGLSWEDLATYLDVINKGRRKGKR